MKYISVFKGIQKKYICQFLREYCSFYTRDHYRHILLSNYNIGGIKPFVSFNSLCSVMLGKAYMGKPVSSVFFRIISLQSDPKGCASQAVADL
jgi:hypothetical protein